MKRIYWLLLTFVFIITSCSSGGYRSSNRGRYADEACEEIFNAVKSKNEDDVKRLFSKVVCNNVYGFDESVTDFLEFFQGDSMSFNRAPCLYESREKEAGIEYTEIEVSFDIETSEQKYHVAFKKCMVDEDNPENVGIISLYIINACNWKVGSATYWGKGKCLPGIHIETDIRYK